MSFIERYCSHLLNSLPQRNKVVVIPDMHGKSFWLNQLENNSDLEYYDEIVFLGNYFTEKKSNSTKEELFDEKNPFLEAMKMKMENPQKVTLLIGHNEHRLGSLIPKSGLYHSCYDDLLDNNCELFNLTKTIRIGDKIYLFTHAGVTWNWIGANYENLYCYSHDELAAKIVGEDYLNKLYLKALTAGDTWSGSEEMGIYNNLVKALDMWNPYTGPIGGTILRRNIRDWEHPEVNPYYETIVTQIVGHYRLQNNQNPKITESVECCDFCEPKIRIINK